VLSDLPAVAVALCLATFGLVLGACQTGGAATTTTIDTTGTNTTPAQDGESATSAAAKTEAGQLVLYCSLGG